MLLKMVLHLKRYNKVKSLSEIIYLIALFIFIFSMFIGDLINIYNHVIFLNNARFQYHYVLPANVSELHKDSLYKNDAQKLQSEIDKATRASKYLLSFKSEYLFTHYSEEKTFDIKAPYYENNMNTVIDICKLSDLSYLSETIYNKSNFISGFSEANTGGIFLTYEAKKLLDIDVNDTIEKTIGDINLKLKVIGFLKPSFYLNNSANVYSTKQLSIDKYNKQSLIILNDELFESLSNNINAYYSIYSNNKLPVSLDDYTITKNDYYNTFISYLKELKYNEEGQKLAIALILLLILSVLEISHAKKRNTTLFLTLKTLGMRKRKIKKVMFLLSTTNFIFALLVSLPFTVFFFFSYQYITLASVILIGLLFILLSIALTYINSIYVT